MNVERSSSWQYGDDDGGTGTVGSVHSVFSDAGGARCYVVWSGSGDSDVPSGPYNIGRSQMFSLKLASPRIEIAAEDDEEVDAGTAQAPTTATVMARLLKFLSLSPEFSQVFFAFLRKLSLKSEDAWFVDEGSEVEAWATYLKEASEVAGPILSAFFGHLERAEWQRFQPGAGDADQAEEEEGDHTKRWVPVTLDKVCVGARVRRGPDWQSKDTDGGPGGLGTVVGFERPERPGGSKRAREMGFFDRQPQRLTHLPAESKELFCTVRWDSGAESRHRINLMNDLYMLPLDSLLCTSMARDFQGRPMALHTLELLAKFLIVEAKAGEESEELAALFREPQRLKQPVHNLIRELGEWRQGTKERFSPLLLSSLKQVIFITITINIMLLLLLLLLIIIIIIILIMIIQLIIQLLTLIIIVAITQPTPTITIAITNTTAITTQ